MPTFGHLFYGFCILIPLLYFTKNKFSYKIAFIFLFNNIYGPDMVALFVITPFHSILGFLILALPYALAFSYGSRFSIVRSDKGFPLKFEDSGSIELNWKNAYFVTAAGGLSHFFIDQFYHRELEMNLWNTLGIDLYLPHLDMLEWSGALYHYYSALRLIGVSIVVVTLILSLYFFSRGWKDSSLLFAVVSGLSLILMLITPLVYEGEREFALMLQITLYILLPLFLLLYAARDVTDNPIGTPYKPRIERKTLLKIVAVISIIFSVFIILYAMIALIMPEFVASLFDEAAPPEIVTSMIIHGAFYGVFAIIFLVGSVGLFFKKDIFRYMTITASLYFIIFGFPLVIALVLCEKDVKALFKRD